MRRYRRNPLTAGRVIEGLAFVVTPDDNKLHTLNETATHLWSLTRDGAEISVDDAVDALCDEFSVELLAARSDAERCLDDLVSRQILLRDS